MISLLRVNSHHHICEDFIFQFWSCFCLHFFHSVLCVSGALLLSVAYVHNRRRRTHFCIRIQSMADIEVERCCYLLENY